MDKKVRNRVIKEAEFIIETKQTIREVAKEFGVSKSTVHKDLSERLEDLNTNLYKQVKIVLDDHTKERHIRGGEVTKNRYTKKKE